MSRQEWLRAAEGRKRRASAASAGDEAPTPGWWITNVRAGGEWRGVKVFEHLSYQRDPFAAGVRVPEPGRSVYLTAQYAY